MSDKVWDNPDLWQCYYCPDDGGTYRIRQDGTTPPLFHRACGPKHTTFKKAQHWLMSICEATEEEEP